MGIKKPRKNVRKIEVPIGTSTEFELGDKAPDIQGGRRRENIGRGRRQRNNRGRRGRGPGGQKLHSHRWRRQWPEKDPELRGVKVKWTQRLEERLAHHSSNLGSRNDI